MTYYPLSSVEKIYKKYGDDSKIEKLIKARIKDMKKHGFYIDMIERCKTHFIDSLKETFENNEKFPNVKIDDYFECIKEYTNIDGLTHSFIHIKPNGFNFEYACFKNMFDVFHLTGQMVYANSFWGIYITNDTLKMHELIQPDFFTGAWMISEKNIYDGGNLLLPISFKYNYGIIPNHIGAVFTSWKDWIDTNEKYSKAMAQGCIDEIELKKNEIKNLKKRLKQFEKNNKMKIEYLKKIEL